ncbi:GNAT family N-acetyltransferase [Paraburkholderia phymatum]|uniref:GCN5-related N-acetyltransferase n=1 Tax=Paraburkholderia phymatum (strain DSM 17167 / CIP 108236 / LMG 21445 / STM815) TaxID=391038 RepID=B2JWU4_PARP8|nr:GNAT family N-acetyltransferase [Paraburkholderia phymatum]ACC75421.1 GCN5-related N-acetyltransferase [Paraburkholderia phymatum STM815]
MESTDFVNLKLRPCGPGDEAILLRILKPSTALRAQGYELLGDVVQFGQHDTQLANAMLAFADGVPIGVLNIDRRPTEWRITALHIDLDHRGKGYGSLLLIAVQDEAQLAKVSVSAILERGNPAVRLFIKHGFTIATETDVEVLLKWRAPAR